MSSSSDPDLDTRRAPLSRPDEALSEEQIHAVVEQAESSDSEDDAKELTPPPSDPREKARKHAANVAREMADSERKFVDVLKLIVEVWKVWRLAR